MSLQFQLQYDLLPKLAFELTDGLFVNGVRYRTGVIRKPVAMDNRLADAEPNADRVSIVRDAHYYARLVTFDNLERSTTMEMILNLTEVDYAKIAELTGAASKLPLDDSGAK